MAGEQVYDIIVLIIIGWLTLRGAMTGMVSQLASLAMVVASFWAAVRFGPVLKPIMQSTLNAQEPWDKVLAITIAFVGASIAVAVLHRVLAKIVSAIRMKKYDHVFGAAFGFLKGALICMIITFFAIMLSEQSREMALQSRSGRVLVRAIQFGQTLLPADVSALIETNLEGFQKQLESNGEDASHTLTQADDIRGFFETIQDGVRTITQRNTTANGSPNDPADTQPSLPGKSESRYTPRETSLPSFVTMQRPATTTDDHTASQPVALEEPISVSVPVAWPSGLTTNANVPGNAAGYTNVGSHSAATIPAASSQATHSTAPSADIVAPSSRMQPMTSSTTPTAIPAGETDWRTLLRGIR